VKLVKEGVKHVYEFTGDHVSKHHYYRTPPVNADGKFTILSQNAQEGNPPKSLQKALTKSSSECTRGAGNPPKSLHKVQAMEFVQPHKLVQHCDVELLPAGQETKW